MFFQVRPSDRHGDIFIKENVRVQKFSKENSQDFKRKNYKITTSSRENTMKTALNFPIKTSSD